MLRNYLAVALRNLTRTRFYSSISIFSLSVGLCVATLAGVTLRSELSYDNFIPGYDSIYLVPQLAVPAGHPILYDLTTPAFVASLLKLNFHQIRAVTRLAPDEVRMRHDLAAAKEKIYWADPTTFDILPLPVVAGDLKSALRRPDGIVLTRSTAQKYFGRDDPIGQVILVDDIHTMTVAAVLEDLPTNGSTFESGIFASGLAAFSALSKCDRDAPQQARSNAVLLCARTYLQLQAGTDVNRLRHEMADFLRTSYPTFPGMLMSVGLIRTDRVHTFEGLNPGAGARLATIGAIALAVLFTACIVFVNLATARSARRSLEVGIRKACGASRKDVFYQFVGESLVYVVLAACLGLVLTGLALPHVNAFLDTNGVLDLARDGALVVTLAVGILVIGILAGAYPALVLSAFRPSAVLKGAPLGKAGTFARKALVVLQFSVLIGLLIAVVTIYRQRMYATHEAMRVDTDQMLILRAPCTTAMLNELRILSGVRGAGCSTEALLDRAAFYNFKLRDGSDLAADSIALDFGIFDLYGTNPVAGNLPTNHDGSSGPLQNSTQVVINQTASQRFGFSTPAAAIGQPLPLADAGTGGQDLASKTIIAVVPDFAFDAGLQKIRPAIYEGLNRDAMAGDLLINVKLRGRDIPETLQAIDRTIAATGPGADHPTERFFLSQYIQNLYLGVLREAQILGIFALVTVVLSCLGMIGLSAATSEYRTREIGIRKALGATNADILRMLLWQFAKPILWANVIAWIASALLLRRWLEGFADHIELNPLTFVAAGAIALTIALLSVATHAGSISRARPVTALRYE